jgi:hypothetical protein
LATIAIALAAPALAQTSNGPATRYRLQKESSYQEGCFDPCACPVLIREPLEGSFQLVPTGSDWLFRYFDVRNVDWRVGRGSSALRARGSGKYRIGGEFAVQHQLTLDLQINDGPLEHFDSGLVAGGGNFPRIDIVISLHGVFCYDKVFDLHARPAPDVSVERDAVSWLPVNGALGFDVVVGDLGALRAAGGDFTAAAAGCVANDLGAQTTVFDADPAPGEAFWFVVRYGDAHGGETYDDDAWSQQASRDPGINGAPGSCP